MSTKSPWGKVGAWAAEAEREEEEERVAAAAKAAAPQPSFPSLKEAVTTTTTTAKQKKKTKMTLQEFTMQQSNKLTPEEMIRLPTGPKDRSPDEMQHGRLGLGGGFSNYGTRIGSMGPNQRSYRFDDDERRGGPMNARVSEPDQPSRADGVDNWASMKREMQPQTLGDNSFGRTGSKYTSLGGGGGGASRADEVDNWGSVKKFVSQTTQPRSSGFSRPEVDRWPRNEPKSEAEVVVKVNRSNPFGAARPREEVLAEKGLDWKKLDLEVEAKKKLSVSGGSRPTSSHSSRPGSAHSTRSETAGEVVVKQRPKVNPFGDAKPREVLLEEKGLDWKKIDLELEHKRVDRLETEEEKNLKQEIENLRKELPQKLGDEQTSVQELIHKMEQEFDILVRELDDKVRYSQKIYERPGSGSGRPPSWPGSYEDPRVGFQDRPPSRPGAYEDSRVGYQDRPPSRPGAYEESRVGFQDRPPSRPGAYEDYTVGYQDRPPSRPGAYEESRVGFQDRPPSRPGAYEEPRFNYHDKPRSRPGAYEEPRGGFPQRSFSSMGGGYQVDPRAVDYNERPRSRGTVNSWTRPGDDRRGVQSGGGRGFFGSREVDRTGSRW